VTVPDPPRSLLDSIPSPDSIRDRLTRLFAEARLLRSLLRLSESKSRTLATNLTAAAEQKEVSRAQ
jgi:hypothetical protein